MSNTARSSSIAKTFSATYGKTKAKPKTKTKRAPNVGRERADEVLAILASYIPKLKDVPVEAFAEIALFLNECRTDDIGSAAPRAQMDASARRLLQRFIS